MRESKRRNEIEGETRRGERERGGGLGDRESERGRERYVDGGRGSERGESE